LSSESFCGVFSRPSSGRPRHYWRCALLIGGVFGVARACDALGEDRRTDEEKGEQNRAGDRPVQNRPGGGDREAVEQPPLGLLEEEIRMPRPPEQAGLREPRRWFAAGE